MPLTASIRCSLLLYLCFTVSPSIIPYPSPLQAYKVADHLRACPPVERVSLPLCPQERLTPLQIAHFAACLR